MYLAISRPQAKAILDDAKAHGIEDVDVETNKRGEVFVGFEFDVEEDPEAPAGEQPSQ